MLDRKQAREHDFEASFLLGRFMTEHLIRVERQSVPITQDELATLVNVSRTTLLQILRRFEERGLVEQAYRALRVVDAAGLKEIAEERQS